MVCGVCEEAKFKVRPVRERKKKHKKRPREGPKRTILGPNWSNSKTEVRLFLHFRAVSGREKKRKENSENIFGKITFFFKIFF